MHGSLDQIKLELPHVDFAAWPPDYERIRQWRQIRCLQMLNPEFAGAAFEYYRDKPAEFIAHWCDTYDPRNAADPSKQAWMPFIPFAKQREFIRYLHELLVNEQSGLIEKSRDMGATWIACAFSVWVWLFIPGASVGWGSRKENLVDKLGDMDSIFEKMRQLIRRLPPCFLPIGFNEQKHMTYMRIINGETGASITGESGDDIGRGGRKLIYFKDESAHYERPESIEAALADNTRIQVDISSVNGLGNVFHRRREAGKDWVCGRPMKPNRVQVFVMDWRDHPEKDERWYKRRFKRFEREGLTHVFRQEIDRNYAASVEGTIIPLEWIRAAVDAHIKLNMPEMEEGSWMAGLDVADEGGDTNALAKRKGVVLRYAEEWGNRDTGRTTRKVVFNCAKHGKIEIQYDCIGVGAGVKAEANRLVEIGDMPKGMQFIPWNAGLPPLMPDEHLIEDDEQSPLNKDYFANIKAQGWWHVSRRFYKTYRAVTKGIVYPASELISIDGRLPLLRQIEKQLAQPTQGQSPGRLKMMVNKKPKGTKSPNIADAIVECFWPATDPNAYDDSLDWVGTF